VSGANVNPFGLFEEILFDLANAQAGSVLIFKLGHYPRLLVVPVQND